MLSQMLNQMVGAEMLRVGGGDWAQSRSPTWKTDA
jgi:hypothetical protein